MVFFFKVSKPFEEWFSSSSPPLEFAGVTSQAKAREILNPDLLCPSPQLDPPTINYLAGKHPRERHIAVDQVLLSLFLCDHRSMDKLKAGTKNNTHPAAAKAVCDGLSILLPPPSPPKASFTGVPNSCAFPSKQEKSARRPAGPAEGFWDVI